MDFWLILGPLNLEFWRFYCRRVAKIEKSPFPKFNQFFIDFGPHLGSIFAQYWLQNSTLFRHRFLDAFLDAFFRFLVEKGRQKGPKWRAPFSQNAPRNTPWALQNRIRDATLIFHRFCIDLGTHFDGFLKLSGPILPNCLARSPFSPFPKPPNYQISIRRFPPGVRRSTLCVHNDFWRPFWHWFSNFFRKRRKCSRLYVFQ